MPQTPTVTETETKENKEHNMNNELYLGSY